jgi:solute carrier family 1 (high affinity glutamate transporter) protein 1
MDQTDNPAFSIQPDGPNKDVDTNGHLLLIGMAIAIATGVILGGCYPDLALKFSILGKIFLNSLMMIVVPLVVLSMIVGIAGLGNIRNLGSIGWRTLLYYMTTTGISVLIGIILVNIIAPGKGISHGEEHPEFTYVLEGVNNHTVQLTNGKWKKTRYNKKYILILMDQGIHGVIKSITDNSATVELWENRRKDNTYYVHAEDGTRLKFCRVNGRLVSIEPTPSLAGSGVKIDLSFDSKVCNRKEKGVISTLTELMVGNKETGREGIIPRNIFNAMVRMEILPLIIFSLLIGAALSALGERGRVAIEIISILNDAIMRLVSWIMFIAPFGIFGLIAGRVGGAGGFSGFLPELAALGKYSFTVILGLTLHGLIVLPFILMFIGRRNPWNYMAGMASALLNAFSSASSVATLPLTMDGVQKKNNISGRTASFVLPLGATINMDGTALYEAVAAMFIAQVYGIVMGPGEQAVIFLTATLAAIGAAGIPEAGLVTMVIVLRAVDLPLDGIGLILTIDWLLDRFRTTVNVWGDSVGGGVIETLERRR